MTPLLRIRFNLLLLALPFCWTGCNSTYVSKPAGYPAVYFPKHEYRGYSPSTCPYTFEYPVYATITRDTSFFGEPTENPCWFNLNFPDFNATVYMSYKEISSADDIDRLEHDAHSLSYKHTIKAEYIDEGRLSSAPDVKGLIYEIGGNAASNTQFYLTDSIRHFIRGSLYFNTEPNVDSLGVVINFLKQDIYHFIKTFRWKEEGKPAPPQARKPD